MVEDLRATVGKYATELATVKENLRNSENDRQELRRRLGELERHLAKTVTDEEFAAYTRQATESQNRLIERIGRIVGHIDGLLNTRKS